MRIKEQGNRLQLLRTIYVPEAKRGKDVMFASLSKYDSQVPDEVKALLEPDELEKLEAHLQSCQEAASASRRRSALVNVPWSLNNAMEALKDAGVAVSMAPDQVAKIWESLDAMRSAMRKAGLAKPKAE